MCQLNSEVRLGVKPGVIRPVALNQVTAPHWPLPLALTAPSTAPHSGFPTPALTGRAGLATRLPFLPSIHAVLQASFTLWAEGHQLPWPSGLDGVLRTGVGGLFQPSPFCWWPGVGDPWPMSSSIRSPSDAAGREESHSSTGGPLPLSPPCLPATPPHPGGGWRGSVCDLGRGPNPHMLSGCPSCGPCPVQ